MHQHRPNSRCPVLEATHAPKIVGPGSRRRDGELGVALRILRVAVMLQVKRTEVARRQEEDPPAHRRHRAVDPAAAEGGVVHRLVQRREEEDEGGAVEPSGGEHPGGVECPGVDRSRSRDRQDVKHEVCESLAIRSLHERGQRVVGQSARRLVRHPPLGLHHDGATGVPYPCSVDAITRRDSRESRWIPAQAGMMPSTAPWLRQLPSSPRERESIRRSRFVVTLRKNSCPRQGGASPRFTVTLFFCVKLSSMPSSENSRPIPLCLTPP